MPCEEHDELLDGVRFGGVVWGEGGRGGFFVFQGFWLFFPGFLVSKGFSVFFCFFWGSGKF